MTITVCGDFVPIGRGVGAVKYKKAISTGVKAVLKESKLLFLESLQKF